MDVEPSRRTSRSGFTLIELLVTIAVIAILASIAVPSFQGVIRSNRAASEVNQILSLLTIARSEAIKRNTNVSLCPTPNGEKCDPDQAWAEGVMIFLDPDGNGTRDSAAEIPIEVVRPLSRVSSITPTSGFSAGLTYNALGSLNRQAGHILLSPHSGDSKYDRKLTISPTGRARVE